MKIQNQGFDHIEFIVGDLSKHSLMWEKMGFECIGKRDSKKSGIESVVMSQGLTRIILSRVTDLKAAGNDPRVAFHERHGDGICVLALDVENSEEFYQETTKRGARSAMKPERFESALGSVVRSEVYTPEDIRFAFIERKQNKSNTTGPALFDQDLEVSTLKSPSPFNLKLVDHLTNNVDMGQYKTWSEYYQKVFGFNITRHYKISTGRTGLISDVMQSADFKIKVPINEATERESQVQEFVDRFKGAGVQHLALFTTDILDTLKKLRENGFKFLSVPPSYYKEVPTRVPGVTEDLAELEKNGILLDGEGEGYLLQIFSEELVGPFFLEFIQRKGNQGFGEGNFKALFQAIERDQFKRGTLK
ncbi:MAG: 4-hydroxyphenylpyruvate dioxygenase [Xanthomonadaceae bacterium]|nr:4-hydroxyphenylpyruvate dioxygenase [Xanthomonadaceae bacterium]